jgi:hypothetical protein
MIRQHHFCSESVQCMMKCGAPQKAAATSDASLKILEHSASCVGYTIYS